MKPTTQAAVLRWAITIGALAIVLVRLYWPNLKIDGVSALLIGIATVPWLQPLFKSLELPGGWKVEFRDFEAVRQKAEDAGLVPRDAAAPASTTQYAFQQIAGSDRTLALAGLRIELEKRLIALARSAGLNEQPRGIERLLRFLEQREVLDRQEAGVVRDLARVLNQAVHGQEVDARTAAFAEDFGAVLLSELERKQQGESGPPGA